MPSPRFNAWVPLGTHTFLPTDKEVVIAPFDLALGEDTVWVRITQLNDPATWPFAYGILKWVSANGASLGSVKAFPNRSGEIFRLGVGLSPSDLSGSITFTPRGYNLGWLKAGFPWELKFEATAATTASEFASGVTGSFVDSLSRTGLELVRVVFPAP